MAAPEQHARLSASKANQWLHCTPSLRLEEGMPDQSSAYAEAGRLAHAIAELKARRYFVEPMPEGQYRSALKKLRTDPSYDKAMDAATDQYLDHLKARAMTYPEAPFVALETRVDYGHIAPEGFGTADCLMLGSGRLDICDYKNGAGVPVDAEENPQMMLYALGALRVYFPIYGNSIRRVHLSIIQPNAGGVKEWETTRAALEQWGEEVVKPAAALAWAGKGDFVPGAWCRFCKARPLCTARAAKLLAVEPEAPTLAEGSLSPEAKAEALAKGAKLLDDTQVGDVLARALELEAWVKDLKEYAFSAALAGRTIPGFKLVAGRSSREWQDTDSAFQTLTQRGVAEAMLWERNPISVAKLEKALGKKPFAAAAEGLVAVKPGKPALVPEGDKRPAWSPARTAFGPCGDDT